MDGMAVKLTINSLSDSDTGRLVYSLRDAQGSEIVHDTIDVSKFKNGKINKIKFDKSIDDCEEKSYTVTLGAEDIDENSNIGIYYDPFGKENGIAGPEGEMLDGTIIFRTITHRFDVETFIVTMCLITYLFVFFRVLYKMFS